MNPHELNDVREMLTKKKFSLNQADYSPEEMAGLCNFQNYWSDWKSEYLKKVEQDNLKNK